MQNRNTNTKATLLNLCVRIRDQDDKNFLEELATIHGKGNPAVALDILKEIRLLYEKYVELGNKKKDFIRNISIIRGRLEELGKI